MRLLIVTQKVNKDDPILGFFHRWIIEFAKHCESIVVICLEEGVHELPVNVRVLSLGKELSVASGQWSVVSKFRWLINFYRYIWRERNSYDAVFVHMNPIYVVFGGIIWRLMRKNIYMWYTHKHVDQKLKIAQGFVRKIFTASKESFRLSSDKVIVTGHGIDTDYYVPIPRPDEHDSIKLITVGRVAPVKNVDLIVDSFTELRKNRSDMSLTIVGGATTSADKKYFENLKHSVVESGLSGLISFTGPVAPQEILLYLQDSDIFVNMSNTGSLDKAVLEAMACGLITVSSNEAFKEILSPHSLFVKEQTVDNCGAVLSKLLARDLTGTKSYLREYVVSKHSLYNLIPFLINHMNHEASR